MLVPTARRLSRTFTMDIRRSLLYNHVNFSPRADMLFVHTLMLGGPFPIMS